MAIQIQSYYFMNFKLFTFVDKTDETAQKTDETAQ